MCVYITSIATTLVLGVVETAVVTCQSKLIYKLLFFISEDYNMEPINVLFLSSMIFSGKEICVVKKSIPPSLHANKEILRITLL
jgi:hypothetical protein